MFDRREFFATGAALILVGRIVPAARAEASGAIFAVARSEAEWRDLLTPEQFHVLREHGTEYPGTSPLLNEYRAGIFSCAGCGQDLFSSDTKYDSRTGWPSFWAPLDGAIGTAPDNSLGMRRIAAAAAGISVMSSTTGRDRPGCAIASTAWR